MNFESLKSSEVPGSIRVVIADDEEGSAAWTSQAWSSVLQASPSLAQPEILTAASGDDLMVKALGLMDRAADVVVLDNKYETNWGDWKPTENMLSLIAQKRGVAFEPIKKPDRGNWSVSGVMPDDLYHPNATHFAILLRFMGFSGTIIAISNSPPQTKYIAKEIHSLNDYLQSFGTQVGENPINAVLTKPSRYHECSYATGMDEIGWIYKDIEISDFSEAIKALVNAL
ncbi:MAG TPA: hypothetical protein VMR81_06460 [Patescibacteria group bacterium]|nr:hypothetical protein [Patescibacteria group bacterium]